MKCAYSLIIQSPFLKEGCRSDFKASVLVNHLGVIPNPGRHPWIMLWVMMVKPALKGTGRRPAWRYVMSGSCLMNFPRMHSCAWLFSDDYWLKGFQAFFSTVTQTTQNGPDCVWAEFLSLGTYAALVSLHHAIAHVSIMGSWVFGYSNLVCLYSLIDFPVESEAHKQLGTDSIHCFHFYGTMMISPAAALPACARLLSLDLINWEVAVNYQSIFWVLITRQGGKPSEWYGSK